ncbi:LiaI-LiaF-like domain-containing protein [Pedobacter sp. Leaf194]|uniref:LiaF transmembrane domain-containing protein n=1 Tax=Pedobacter sp. Leaf194 TaxID=1736297 RepID=UPI00070356B6|nr:DUF5668 domain-containing protein [Pedobacter sp. Leaf194]KQS41730.1 hypothetical protein ASG14_04580 [Pedobacter sp. Leaf194]
MENLIRKNYTDKQNALGILVIVIGSIFLLKNIGWAMPHWIFSWHTIMLAAGLWIGYRKNFQGGGWLALTVIGGFFTLQDITVFDFELSKITTALVLIGLGLWVLLKPRKYKTFNNNFRDSSAFPKEN